MPSGNAHLLFQLCGDESAPDKAASVVWTGLTYPASYVQIICEGLEPKECTSCLDCAFVNGPNNALPVPLTAVLCAVMPLKRAKGHASATSGLEGSGVSFDCPRGGAGRINC